MTVYGYARVSTNGQTLAAQDAVLRTLGCARVFSEKASSAKAEGASKLGHSKNQLRSSRRA